MSDCLSVSQATEDIDRSGAIAVILPGELRSTTALSIFPSLENRVSVRRTQPMPTVVLLERHVDGKRMKKGT